MENQLTKLVQETNLEENVRISILDHFTPLYDQAKELEPKSKIIVQDASQTDLMKEARSVRLKLREIRIKAEKERKYLKEDALKYGNAVQGAYNAIEFFISPMEKHLENQEKFIEIEEEKKREKIRTARIVELEPYSEYIPVNIDLASMGEDDYCKLRDGAIFQHEARVQAEREAEKQRQEQERIAKEEQERIRQENELLRKEREEREKQIAKEKEEQERIAKEQAELLRKEREEREKIEQQKAEIERAAKERLEKERLEKERLEKERMEKEAKAAAAPDMEKIIAYADSILNLKAAECTTADGRKLMSELYTKIMNTAAELKSKAVSYNKGE
jgi:hypothetical protein